MTAFEEFERDLRDALTRLYDPAYEPTQFLWAATGCDPQHGPEQVQAAIIQAIGELEPGPSVPTGARIRRLYEVLRCRYLQKLTQEETARRLAITPRHLRREQQQAVRTLAQHLWKWVQTERPTPEGREGAALEPESDLGAERADWQSQVKLEVASLQRSAPGSVADVSIVIHRVCELAQALASKHGVTMKLGSLPPTLTATIHPSALDQVLLSALTGLVREMSGGEISFCARREGGFIIVDMACAPSTLTGLPNDYLVRELLRAEGGSMEFARDGDGIVLRVTLPALRIAKVLVVDDNADLVHFYRRYTTNTRYEIIHLTGGERVLDEIEASSPDIIVLDVMLPDIDGWELLTHIREHPKGRSIPVIVCSVVREEELAQSLGAASYVAKPVRRQQFLEALDRVLSQVAATETRAHASNAIAC